MTPQRIGRGIVGWLDSKEAARTVWILALGALALCVGLGVKQVQLTTCQARYADASNVSQRARAEAADVDRKAQDQLFRAIAADPRDAITAVRTYNQARATADAQRARNPIPPAPSTNCG